MVLIEEFAHFIKTGLVKLLEIKDCDIRIMILEQGRDAVDKGLHAGGAFSTVIPMVSLFYGGYVHVKVDQPTEVGQDMFVLSKGHAVATMASVYADLGYFDRNVLKNSRSVDSILNGHPGPILPGVHISTGPEGHGMPVAQGLALAGKREPKFDVYCITGDGELQAGMIWEAAMYSGVRHLDNLCVLVDKNEGQLDNARNLLYPMQNLHRTFKSFGWRVFNINGMQYGPVIEALETFKYVTRDGRPTVIICNTRKGFGGFSSFMVHHKVTLYDVFTEQEIQQQRIRRRARVEELFRFLDSLRGVEEKARIRRHLFRYAMEKMNLDIKEADRQITKLEIPVRTQQAPVRDKRISYDEKALPKLDLSKEIQTSEVITRAMQVFAKSGLVVSVDSDLGTTSGLEAGIGFVDQDKSLNVGVAESNMTCIGEAFAVLGYNTWVSTFCPFFDWRVLRRIAINYQERQEAIGTNSWLSQGHNLDLTFLATASNFDTKTNGATHMGNDDLLVFAQIAHIKIIDTSCPNQVLGVMKWIMEGNKGLVYLRMMRAASKVIYGDDFNFEYGKGYWVHGDLNSKLFLITSGRQVHESILAAEELEKDGIKLGIIDMPSIDKALLIDLYDSARPIIVAEQNNGYIWTHLKTILFENKREIMSGRLIPINCLDKEGNAQFIHSATYCQLIERFDLSPQKLKLRICELV